MKTSDNTLENLKLEMQDYNEGDSITIDVNVLADLVNDLEDAQEGQFLKGVILMDSDGNPSHVLSVRGAEAGLDHLELIAQSELEEQNEIATRHRIFSEEIELSPDETV